MEKMKPKLVALQSCKKLEVLEKHFFGKKSFQLICVDKTYKKVCGIFLKINGSRCI